jgi:hypothetical protein
MNCSQVIKLQNTSQIIISGLRGPQGVPGSGVGLPAGGNINQTLVATSDDDYQVGWKYPWVDLVAMWAVTPVLNVVVPVLGGSVYDYEYKNGTTLYRHVPSPYNAAQDAFYTTYAGGVLSGLVSARDIEVST